MTVQVFLSQRLALLGVPILHRLTRKGCFPNKGLHHATAWGIALTARLQPGELVLDPMAGKGIILLEAAAFWPGCSFLGLEADPSQLAQAHENRSAALGESRSAGIDFLLGDARNLPFTAASVDVILCDMPFGRQYGDTAEIPALYRSVLASLYTALRFQTGRALLLTSQQHLPHLLDAAGTAAAGELGLLQLVEVLYFRFGGHRDRQQCALCCFRKLKEELPTEIAAEAFDSKLCRSLADAPEQTWKDLKPALSLYKPRRAIIASGGTTT